MPPVDLFYTDLYHLGLAGVFSSAAFPQKERNEMESSNLRQQEMWDAYCTR